MVDYYSIRFSVFARIDLALDNNVLTNILLSVGLLPVYFHSARLCNVQHQAELSNPIVLPGLSANF